MLKSGPLMRQVGAMTMWNQALTGHLLPRAANPFDFATIGDVMLTVEYTALSDANLRSRVIAGVALSDYATRRTCG